MYGLLIEGEPFQVFARREGAGSEALVLKFECKDGMGILGIRKVGRSDPPPSTVYEESDIEPGSLRAGRFVHVLSSGQRQSYALSRISPDLAARLPADKWVELKPHTEYGFRYLVAPEDQLLASGPTAAVAVAAPAGSTAPAGLPTPATPPAAAAVVAASRPEPVAHVASPPPRAEAPHAPPHTATPAPAPPPLVANAPRSNPPDAAPRPSGPLPPPQTPMAPPIAEAALKALSKEQAVDHLKAEMAKVHQLQHRIAELEDALRRSRSREKDLVDVLARWQQH